MWNLQNFARQGFIPDESQGADKVRFMLRSALSLEDQNILVDVLMAM